MGNFLTLFFLGLCFLSINFFFIAVAGLLRYLPQMISVSARLLAALMRVSIHAYQAVFKRLGPVLLEPIGIDITQGWGRMGSAAILSLIVALLVFVLAGGRFGWLIFLGGLMHGFGVSLLWDRFLYVESLRMGEET
jgi:hypothetical protein